MSPKTTLKLVFLPLFCISNFAVAAVHKYQIRVDEKIETASVNICFAGKAPEYLAVESKIGNNDLLEFPHSSQGNIEIQGRYWKTKRLPINACLDYKINIKRHHAKRRKSSPKRQNVAVIKDNTWLWLPEVIEQNDDIEFNFSLPDWAEISAPWQQVNFSEHRFRLGKQPQEWGYNLLIGDFNIEHALISKGHYLNIASTKSLTNATVINRWLVDTARALNSYLGEYPVAQTQIVLIAKPELKRGPVPWGDFSRGNGFGIRFVVVPTVDIKDFYADWTATNEFSHQLLPKIHYDDIWLSEGLASYLQYILMAQSNRLSKEDAWHELYKGFQRGEKGTKKIKKEPLSLTSSRRQKRGRSGRTMRIYWSGALFFMKADIALRKLSDGEQGLNTVLLKLNSCCISGSKIWRGAEIASKLDQLSSSKVFSLLYIEFANGTEFPDYKSDFEKLGIGLGKSNSVPASIKKDSIGWRIMH